MDYLGKKEGGRGEEIEEPKPKIKTYALVERHISLSSQIFIVFCFPSRV